MKERGKSSNAMNRISINKKRKIENQTVEGKLVYNIVCVFVCMRALRVEMTLNQLDSVCGRGGQTNRRVFDANFTCRCYTKRQWGSNKTAKTRLYLYMRILNERREKGR